MYIHAQTIQTLLNTREISIDCPHCQQKDVPAEAKDAKQVDRIWFLFDILPRTVSWIECKACNTHFPTKESADELARMKREDLTPLLSKPPPYPTTMFKIAVAGSILLFCFPFAPLLLSAVGLLGLWPYRGAWHTTAICMLILSLIQTITLIVLMAIY